MTTYTTRTPAEAAALGAARGTLTEKELPFWYWGSGPEPDLEDGTLIVRVDWDLDEMQFIGIRGQVHATVPGRRDETRFWSSPAEEPARRLHAPHEMHSPRAHLTAGQAAELAAGFGDFPCCATPPAGSRVPGLDALGFSRSWQQARAHAQPGTMVVFEPEGTEPASRTSAITRVTYEEDIAGAIVIHGRPAGPLSLADLAASSDAAEIVDALRRLPAATLNAVRLGLDVAGAEGWDGWPAATDPAVVRYAALVLNAIHADMAVPPAGLRPIPRNVGSFAALHDYRDANVWLITLIPYLAEDCDCGFTAAQRAAGEVHADDCASGADGGSYDRWGILAERVSDEVDRLLAAEAAAFGPAWTTVTHPETGETAQVGPPIGRPYQFVCEGPGQDGRGCGVQMGTEPQVPQLCPSCQPRRTV